MEAKELRIGNYVNFKFHKDCGGVKGIEVFVSDLEIILHNGMKSKYYTPIPLTEEWLVKFGFEENSTSFTNSIAYPCIVKLKNQSNCIFYNSLQIKHVHQLQNLYFALTNEELTIKK